MINQLTPQLLELGKLGVVKWIEGRCWYLEENERLVDEAFKIPPNPQWNRLVKDYRLKRKAEEKERRNRERQLCNPGR